METGGKNSQKQSKHILKLAGLFIPAFLAGYGLMVILNFVPGSLYATTEILLVIITSWLVLASLQLFRPTKSGIDTLIHLAGYHLLASAYLLFISGLSTPISSLWVVLMLASYIYCHTQGLKLNLIFTAVLLAVELLLGQLNTGVAPSDSTWMLLLVVLTGLITISIIKYHEIDQIAFLRSQRQEALLRQRTSTLVNNLAEAVISTDKDGVVQVYNAAALSLFDTNDSLNGRHIDEIVSLHEGNRGVISLLDVLKKTHSVTVRDDLHIKFEDDRLRIEVTMSPIRSGFKSGQKQALEEGYVLIFRDVTKAKSLEEERDEFISVVSHELRTPITIAEGTISNTQLLLEREGTPKGKLLESINTAHEQIIFLARMVNDLSTLSRAERGIADESEDIDVKDMVYKIYNGHQPEAESKGILLNIETVGRLGTVHASRLYLEELIHNFIGNAIKYTHEGSVTLKARRQGGRAEFAVQDTGIGISKSDQKKIFDKFYRAEDYRTKTTKGTGLGLYVASKLGRKLNTKIELSSRLNHGSTFSFSLPVKQSTKAK